MSFLNNMKIVSMLAKIYLKKDYIIKNWKTTLFGTLTGITTLLATVDFNKPIEPADFILPVLFIVWSAAQKDANVTGGNITQQIKGKD